MNAEELLELLGNESRRRILELLSKKPCYVSEISYCLGMAPKVVLEHLEKLERAGIVSSFEEGRRRYYYISKRVTLEVTITPHRFDVELRTIEPGNVEDILQKLREFERRLSSHALDELEEVRKLIVTMRNAVESRIDAMIDRIVKDIEFALSDEVEKTVYAALAKGMSVLEIIERLRIPHREVERALESLAARGLVKRVKVNGRDVWSVR